jgi:hypothetical protein
MRSLVEWLLALGVLAGVVWVGAPVVQRLAPQGSAAVTLVESVLPDLPGDVPDDAQSVPLLMLLDGGEVRLGMTEKAFSARPFSRLTAGPVAIEPGVIDDRMVLPLRSGATRFWVVLDRTEAGHERLVTAIYVK